MTGRLRSRQPGRGPAQARFPQKEDETRRPRSISNCGAPSRSVPFGSASILALQRSVGNALVGRVLVSGRHLGAATVILRRAPDEEEDIPKAAQAEAEGSRPAGQAETSAAIRQNHERAVSAVKEQASARAQAAEREQAQAAIQTAAQEDTEEKQQEAAAAEEAQQAQQQGASLAAEVGEAEPGTRPDQGKTPALPEIEEEGGPFPAMGRAGGSVSLQGRTRASFSYSFRVENETVAPGSSCDGCGRGNPCVHVTGTVVIDCTVTTRVTLPAVPAGLTECQRERVRDTINNTISPHEEQHVAAFETYDGTVSVPFDEQMCRSRYGGFARGLARSAERVRRASAQAASDALDPFRVDVDLDCGDD